MNVYEIRRPHLEKMFASMDMPREREIRYGFTTISSKPDYQVAKYVMDITSQMPDHMTITKIAKVNTRPKVKARDKARKAARKGKQYLRDTTMVEAMSFAEEKPLLALHAYDVVIFPDGGYAVEQDFGHTVLMESIPEVTAKFDDDYYGCYTYERGAFYAHCYAFDEEHAKEICAPKLRELIKKEVEHQREQAAFAEFQAANLPELLGLA